MGIAGFFRWLQQDYEECINNIPQEVVDAALKGEALPSSYAPDYCYDNFYIDMNGLIHPCSHDTFPLPEPEHEQEMFSRLFEQMDLLVKIVRPRKCLVLCVDGVAPRSKMNQQRSRRFRAADERIESDAINREAAEYITSTLSLPQPQMRNKWDHNVITPFTGFMERMAYAVQWFIIKKLNTDDAWRHLTVVFSDAHVAGEGEHKIMQFIRNLRAQPGYDSDTTHVIQGMDADLICLGLATHEKHVSILRNQLNEQIQAEPGKYCYFDLGQYRSMLKEDFHNLGDGVVFERVIDDFVFLCFFVGNDFLPHIPLVSIRTKGIELMLDCYVRNFKKHGYLTEGGEVDYDRLATFFRCFAGRYVAALKKEYVDYSRRRLSAKKRVTERVQALEEEFEKSIKSLQPDRSNAQKVSNAVLSALTSAKKERARFVQDSQPLKFSYASEDFRDDYYTNKFGWSTADRDDFEEKVRVCCLAYLRGVQWVMRYYTQGCPSWSWYYPFHYAPLLEDLSKYCAADAVDTKMKLGTPSHPVIQLLTVLPRASYKALPPQFHAAVADPNSVLAPFYPDSTDCDFSEANFAYEGVLLLPFFDVGALRRAALTVSDLPPDEGRTLLFCHRKSPLHAALVGLLNPPDRGPRRRARVTPEVASRFAIGGKIERVAEPTFPYGAPAKCGDKKLVSRGRPHYMEPVPKNRVVVYGYKLDTIVQYRQEILGSSEAQPADPAGAAAEEPDPSAATSAAAVVNDKDHTHNDDDGGGSESDAEAEDPTGVAFSSAPPKRAPPSPGRGSSAHTKAGKRRRSSEKEEEEEEGDDDGKGGRASASSSSSPVPRPKKKKHRREKSENDQ